MPEPASGPGFTPRTFGLWLLFATAALASSQEVAHMRTVYTAYFGLSVPSPPCSWSQVRCDSQHIASIDFNYLPSGAASGGVIATEIGQLTYLSEVSLQGPVSGTFPDALTKLPALKRLTIAKTKLSGSLPATIGNMVQLAKLELRSNQFSGPLPKSIGGLSNLVELRLGSNQFQGSVPSELGGLAKLRAIEMPSNSFTAVPDFDQLVNAEEIIFSNNKIAGTLPKFQRNKLQKFNFDENCLSGTLPQAVMGSAFTSVNKNCFAKDDPSWSFTLDPAYCGRKCSATSPPVPTTPPVPRGYPTSPRSTLNPPQAPKAPPPVGAHPLSLPRPKASPQAPTRPPRPNLPPKSVVVIPTPLIPSPPPRSPPKNDTLTKPLAPDAPVGVPVELSGGTTLLMVARENADPDKLRDCISTQLGLQGVRVGRGKELEGAAEGSSLLYVPVRFGPNATDEELRAAQAGGALNPCGVLEFVNCGKNGKGSCGRSDVQAAVGESRTIRLPRRVERGVLVPLFAAVVGLASLGVVGIVTLILQNRSYLRMVKEAAANDALSEDFGDEGSGDFTSTGSFDGEDLTPEGDLPYATQTYDIHGV